MEIDDGYKYSELRDGDAIRLIYLQPSQDLESAVECSLEVATLAEYRDNIGDHYLAISYVWGDKNDTRSISVDGKCLILTASLDSALRHVRDDQRVLRIWADGVCINQSDNHERNRQVHLMGYIYSIALHTVIFLGLSSFECDLVLRMISYEAPFATRTRKSPGISFQRLPSSKYVSIVEDEIFPGHGSLDLWKSDSRTTLMQMNQTRVKFRTARVDILDRPEEIIGTSLLELLCTRRGCALSDPRDMIYAHLGLASPTTAERVPIDYGKTVAQVYEDIACSYIEWVGLDTVLSLVEVVQPEKRQGCLPSWVPDWSSRFRPGSPDPPYTPPVNEKPARADYISWTIPHVLAVVGEDCGAVNVLIPQSAWPFLDQTDGPAGLASPSNIGRISQWISRSDEDYLMVRQLIIDLAAKRGPQNLRVREVYSSADSYDREDFGYTIGSPAWAEVASIISDWTPISGDWAENAESTAQVSRTTRKSYPDVFTKFFLHSVWAWAQNCNRSKQASILEDGTMLLLPKLAQLHDSVIRISDPARDIYVIIRGCRLGDVELSVLDQQGIMKDLPNFEFGGILRCKFVTIARDITPQDFVSTLQPIVTLLSSGGRGPTRCEKIPASNLKPGRTVFALQ